jgi:hypothetical protein
VQGVITRLHRVAPASDPPDDPANAAAVLEQALFGTGTRQGLSFEEPEKRALLRVLDMMFREGSLSPPLYCVRGQIRDDLGEG